MRRALNPTMRKKRRRNCVRPNRSLRRIAAAFSHGGSGAPVDAAENDGDAICGDLPVDQDPVPMDDAMQPATDVESSDSQNDDEGAGMPPWFKDQLASDWEQRSYPCPASDDLFPFPSKTVGEFFFWLESEDNGLSRKGRRSLLRMLQGPDFDTRELQGYSLDKLESFRSLLPQQKAEKVTCKQRLVFHQKKNEETGFASVRTVMKNTTVNYYSLVEKMNYALHDPVHAQYSDRAGPRLPSGIGVREFNESNFARNANLVAGNNPLSLMLRGDIYNVGDTVETDLANDYRAYRIERLFHRAAQDHEIQMWAALRCGRNVSLFIS